MKLPEGMTLEGLLDGLRVVDVAVTHSVALTECAQDLVVAIATAVEAGNKLDAALDDANGNHVDGEFSPVDMAVIKAGEDYMDRETELLQVLLHRYVQALTQAEPSDAFKDLLPK
jgi:hypothetical protein